MSFCAPSRSDEQDAGYSHDLRIMHTSSRSEVPMTQSVRNDGFSPLSQHGNATPLKPLQRSLSAENGLTERSARCWKQIAVLGLGINFKTPFLTLLTMNRWRGNQRIRTAAGSSRSHEKSRGGREQCR